MVFEFIQCCLWHFRAFLAYVYSIWYHNHYAAEVFQVNSHDVKHLGMVLQQDCGLRIVQRIHLQTHAVWKNCNVFCRSRESLRRHKAQNFSSKEHDVVIKTGETWFLQMNFLNKLLFPVMTHIWRQSLTTKVYLWSIVSSTEVKSLSALSACFLISKFSLICSL